MNHQPRDRSRPGHIAIIMDGNGRWARQRGQPRVFGHRRGVETVREVIRCCSEHQVPYLTLFAFSSENWRRPEKEVSLLMELFISTLENEIHRMHENGVRLNVIGDVSKFSSRLQKAIHSAQQLTQHNNKLVLNIAANYGGRWDIVNAVKRLAGQVQAGEIQSEDITETMFSDCVSTSMLPEPDLFIRTGGEFRISNFFIMATGLYRIVFY